MDDKRDGLTGKDKRNLVSVCLALFVIVLVVDIFADVEIIYYLGAIGSSLASILGIDELAKRRQK